MLSFIEFSAFHTYNTIHADCSNAVLENMMALCGVYEKLLSKTIPGSDIWNINHSNGQPVSIHPHTARILETALTVNRASFGAFNIAIGAAAAEWHFTDGTAIIPSPQRLAQVVQQIDCQQIILTPQTVQVPAGMQLDLGGIAKGYITDQIAATLRSHGVSHAVLNFGGNIVTIGKREDDTPWQIGLQNPFQKGSHSFFATIPCVNSTIVTSAVYERGFNLNGKRYHHILDPRTGWPVDNGIASVSLFGHNSMLADAISTACFVLGLEEGRALAHRFNMQALYITNDGQIHVPQGLPLHMLA